MGGGILDTDSQSRKWQITINNPKDKNLSHDKLREQLFKFKSCVYWCLCDEVGEEGTYHTHVYMACSSAVRFSTVKKRFEGGHFEMANGTSQQNKDYVKKEGKWEKDRKKETNLSETFEEYGNMPVERQGARNDLADLYDMIKEGMTDTQILDINPEYLFCIDKIGRARLAYLQSKYRDTRRLDLQVTYVFGETGTGKTRNILDAYGDSNVYRVTDYQHPFDTYECQDVLVFEEFRSSLKISDMLNYLDIYPLVLPARYNSKFACFTKIFIVSNWTLFQQYEEVRKDYVETYNAFLRRVHKVKEYSTSGVAEYSINDYLDKFPFGSYQKL